MEKGINEEVKIEKQHVYDCISYWNKPDEFHFMHG